jgi:alpha-amylase
LTTSQVQRYSDDTFYAFTRGTTFVALTNGGSGSGTLMRNITYHPYKEGTKLCEMYAVHGSSRLLIRAM